MLYRYGKRQRGMTVVATIRYLIMSLLGSGFFLFGVSILYTITGHLLMSNVQQSVIALVEPGQYTVPLVTSLGLMVLGLAIKSALYPFHSWLPNAHGSSTTASSAILSGLVLKGYIILLVKMCYRVFTRYFNLFTHHRCFICFGCSGYDYGFYQSVERDSHQTYDCVLFRCTDRLYLYGYWFGHKSRNYGGLLPYSCPCVYKTNAVPLCQRLSRCFQSSVRNESSARFCEEGYCIGHWIYGRRFIYDRYSSLLQDLHLRFS